MWNSWKIRTLTLFIAGGLLAGLAWGETIEFITYYPAAFDLDNINEDVNITGDLTVFGRVGINTDHPVGPLHVLGEEDANSVIALMPNLGGAGTGTLRVGIGTEAPTQALGVFGNILAASDGTTLLMAERGGTNSFNGLQLLTNGTVQWTLGARDDGSENLHLFDDAHGVTRLFIEQALGNVGIGTLAPENRLHVAGVGDTANDTPLLLERQTDLTNAGVGTLIHRSVTSGDMATGFGAGLSFEIEDGAAGPNTIARIAATRGGTDDQGILTLESVNGATNHRMVLDSNGDVGIGQAFAPTTPIPNPRTTGNLDANDVFLRSAGESGNWASQLADNAGSGVVAGTFVGAQTIDVGFQPAGVMLMSVQESEANGGPAPISEAGTPSYVYAFHRLWVLSPRTDEMVHEYAYMPPGPFGTRLDEGGESDSSDVTINSAGFSTSGHLFSEGDTFHYFAWQ